jgi:uncharacterized OB-fold protein
MNAVVIQACSFCGHACFPPRRLCHRCGGADWNSLGVASGIVEEGTIVHHQADGAMAKPVFLASVRTQVGVLLLARFDAEVERGMAVRLAVAESGAIVGSVTAPG